MLPLRIDIGYEDGTMHQIQIRSCVVLCSIYLTWLLRRIVPLSESGVLPQHPLSFIVHGELLKVTLKASAFAPALNV